MLTPAQVQRNETAIGTLLPEVQDVCRKHLALCQGAGIDLLIVQALRTQAEQDALYAQGRTAPGRIVTNAKFGYSWHCFGKAYDVAIIDAQGKPVWESPLYRKVGDLGQSLGLTWGGSFTAIRGDLGHFQLTGGQTLAQARQAAGITA